MSYNNSVSEKDQSAFPTITVLDVSEEKRYEDKTVQRKCCGCITEQVGVVIILSFYFFYGLLNTLSSLSSLASSDYILRDKIILIISAILYIFMTAIGITGTIAIRKGNTVLLRRLSIALWIFTTLMFKFNIAVFITEVVFKDEYLQACLSAQQETENQGFDASNWDCKDFINAILVRDALKVAIFGVLSFYFAYVVARYSRRTKNEPLRRQYSNDDQRTPTYVVYETRPPTAHDWIPPPTYTVKTSPVQDSMQEVDQKA
ncbi:23230_t:CDS:2 [Dentiscutata erythropus]|uniref:23230_t:CDS:1 n=1 Tax=Dentiscutata erythropus TaxID=1348616 RepID=A0A9N9BF29_9GLOM|nr:23230_t:CDS:2 [Dentiscutata erythropus]